MSSAESRELKQLREENARLRVRLSTTLGVGEGQIGLFTRRNRRIAQDILDAYQEGRKILVLTEGTLQQYAGRLHREHVEKQGVRVYDYIEYDQPQLVRMWNKRQRGYRAMGYGIRPLE